MSKRIWTTNIVKTIIELGNNPEATLNKYIEEIRENSSSKEYKNFINFFQDKADANGTDLKLEVINGIRRIKNDIKVRKEYSIRKFNDHRVLDDWIECKGNSRSYNWRQDYIDVPTIRIDNSKMEVLDPEVNNRINFNVVKAITALMVFIVSLTAYLLY